MIASLASCDIFLTTSTYGFSLDEEVDVVQLTQNTYISLIVNF